MKKSVIILFVALLGFGNCFAEDVLEKNIKLAVMQVDKVVNKSVKKAIGKANDSIALQMKSMDSIANAIDTIAIAEDEEDTAYSEPPQLNVDIHDIVEREDILVIAIVCFSIFIAPFVGLIVLIYLFFKYKRRKEEQRIEMMRIGAANNQDISKFVKDTVPEEGDNEQKDKGIKQMCLGAGLGIFLFIILGRFGAAIGLLIFCIGAGKYLTGRKKKNDPMQHNDEDTENNLNS